MDADIFAPHIVATPLTSRKAPAPAAVPFGPIRANHIATHPFDHPRADDGFQLATLTTVAVLPLPTLDQTVTPSLAPAPNRWNPRRE
jgi:hypothetical protein